MSLGSRGVQRPRIRETQVLAYVHKALRHAPSELGVTAVEYALMVAAIAVVVAVAAFTLGGAASGKLSGAATCMGSTNSRTAQGNCP